jgi:hypothetical protein
VEFVLLSFCSLHLNRLHRMASSLFRSSTTALLLPGLSADYAYPLAVATLGTYTLLTYCNIKVGKARKESKIDYPACYAANDLAAKDPAANRFSTSYQHSFLPFTLR